MSRRFCACLLNISEARNDTVVNKVVGAALSSNKNELPIKSSVLNVFQDKEYNRSVITIVSAIEDIGSSIFAACQEAYSLIDLSKHHGGHPRLGAVDLIPIHPISADVSLEECGTVAKGLAEQLASSIEGTSFFLFGAAHPANDGIVLRRKAVKWFTGKHGSSYDGISSDIGQAPGPKYGLTGIGAIPYVMNCNVTIKTSDVDLGRKIATALRGSTNGGLPGVQAMAFPHEGQIEIACNVQGIYTTNFSASDLNRDEVICSFGNCYHIKPETIIGRIKQMTKSRDIETVESATIVGFQPQECEHLAKHALENGLAAYWETRRGKKMM